MDCVFELKMLFTSTEHYFSASYLLQIHNWLNIKKLMEDIFHAELILLS